jgi:hypothetical protein
MHFDSPVQRASELKVFGYFRSPLFVAGECG